jgi:penicillin-binding protein 2
LRGSYGKKYVEVNALGVEQSVLKEEVPSAGRHIILSIDVDLQNKLEEILAHHLRVNKRTRGSAIVVDVNDGSILALVSLPTFNSNTFAQTISNADFETLVNNEDKPLFNRVISGMYPPGSVIKPFIAAAALEEEIIDRDTSFLSVGGISIGDRFFSDWKKGGHGITNVIKSLAESVNTFFFIIGGGHEKFVGLGA